MLVLGKSNTVFSLHVSVRVVVVLLREGYVYIYNEIVISLN